MNMASGYLTLSSTLAFSNTYKRVKLKRWKVRLGEGIDALEALIDLWKKKTPFFYGSWGNDEGTVALMSDICAARKISLMLSCHIIDAFDACFNCL